MIRKMPESFPLHLTPEEQAAGFLKIILSLGNFVGVYPGDDIEVVARRLSAFDMLIKVQATLRSGETKVVYRHLRFGLPNTRERLRIVWNIISFGSWRSWFRCLSNWRMVDWQHVPDGVYESPSDDCSRILAWRGVVGLTFKEHSVQ
jgi:hypothetical protein